MRHTPVIVNPFIRISTPAAPNLASEKCLNYLHQTVGLAGVQSFIGIDPQFRSALPLCQLREYIKTTSGTDLGFDCSMEVFSSMLALKLLGEQPVGFHGVRQKWLLSLIKSQEYRGRFRFFHNQPAFAPDTDCTSIAAAVLYRSGEITKATLFRYVSEILCSAAPASVPADQNLNPETGCTDGALSKGVVMVYWEDHAEPGATQRGRKHDPAVSANTLYALKLAKREGFGRADEVIAATTEHAVQHLLSQAYKQGTRYYPSPDTFLYFLSELCRDFPDYHQLLAQPIMAAIRERNAAPADPASAADPQSALSISQRVIAADNLGFQLKGLQETLISRQAKDGSWPPAALYTMAKRRFYFGSQAITTMFVLRALQSGQSPQGQSSAAAA